MSKAMTQQLQLLRLKQQQQQAQLRHLTVQVCCLFDTCAIEIGNVTNYSSHPLLHSLWCPHPVNPVIGGLQSETEHCGVGVSMYSPWFAPSLRLHITVYFLNVPSNCLISFFYINSTSVFVWKIKCFCKIAQKCKSHPPEITHVFSN